MNGLVELDIGLDPGRNFGVGVGHDKRVIGGFYVSNREKDLAHPDGWNTQADEIVERLDSLVERRFGHRSWVVRRVGLELPQVYGAAHQKGDQNDLFPLACAVATVARALRSKGFTHFAKYTPREWKGTRTGNGNAVAILERFGFDYHAGSLTQLPDELASIDGAVRFIEALRRALAKRVDIKDSGIAEHNTFDGVGVLLKMLGRFDKHRVIKP